MNQALRLAFCLLAGLLLACQGSTPQPLPPQTVTGAPRAPESPLTAPLPETGTGTGGQAPVVSPADRAPDVPPAEADAPKPAREDGSTLILGSDSAPGVTTNRDLVEASRRERERRRTVQPIAVITDENLKEQAEGGNVTVGNPRQVTAEELAEARQTLAEFAEKEEYWRERARSIRQRWRDAHDQLEPLKQEAEALRLRFFAEENDEVRQREIKPLWDEAQEEVAVATETISQARADLEVMMEEGRRSGALEGWLRTGIELEPWDAESPAESSDGEEPQDPPR